MVGTTIRKTNSVTALRSSLRRSPPTITDAERDVSGMSEKTWQSPRRKDSL